MSWSEKYKRSINCDNPKGFSQRAHCQGRKKLKEQMKPYKTPEQIAKKHRLDVSFIEKQLAMGEPIEHEHTGNRKLAKQIALQHLEEIPDYYTRLKKMETSAKKSHKKYKDVNENMDMIRYCPKCEKNETRSQCSYGPKYWDMFSLPAKLTSSNRYTPNTPHPANEEKDHEYSMARSELSTIISAAKRLKKKIGNREGNLEAWVQSKITKAADYIDTAADYLDSGQGKVNESMSFKESVSIEDANGNPYLEFIDIINPEPLKQSQGIGSQILDESKRKSFSQFMEDWQKVNRQDRTAGLSQKAVDTYRRENPGSKLQTAVTEKKPTGKRAKRRASFCRRMKGMKSKLTSSETARDPDSNINKALRRWRCK